MNKSKIQLYLLTCIVLLSAVGLSCGVSNFPNPFATDTPTPTSTFTSTPTFTPSPTATFRWVNVLHRLRQPISTDSA